MSLTTEPEAMQSTLNNPRERQERYQWRHRLRWREPQRIDVVVGSPWDKFWYWFFMSGSVEEKMLKWEMDRLEEGRRQGLEASNVWRRVKNELDYQVPGTPAPDRRKWKQDAMERVASFHQQDYEAKRYTNPLGVAVQQTLGVGLVFDLDHARPLEDNEQPTTRRLQARAAKSAMRRARELTREGVREMDDLKTLGHDPEELDAKQEEVARRVNEKVELLGKRLGELVPYNDGHRYGRVDHSNSTAWKFLGAHKLRAQRGGVVTNSAVEKLLRWYEVEKLGLDPPDLSDVGWNSTSANVGNVSDPNDDTEIAHLRQRFGGNTFFKEAKQEGDGKPDPDDTETVLV